MSNDQDRSHWGSSPSDSMLAQEVSPRLKAGILALFGQLKMFPKAFLVIISGV